MGFNFSDREEKLSAVCPCCGAHIEPVVSSYKVTLSCSACGWNCAPARRAYKKELIGGALYLALAVAAFGLQAALSPAHDWKDFAFVIFVVMAVVYATYRKSWRALRTVSSSQGGGNVTQLGLRAFEKLIPSQQESTDLFGDLLNVAAPRPITWNWRVKLALLFGGLLLSLLLWFAPLLRNGINTDENAAIVMALLVLLWPTVILSCVALPDFSKSRLLRFGDVTVGRVVWQRRIDRGRNGSVSVVFYAFVDKANRPYIGQGQDYTDNIGQGAPIVVFYDPLDPDRNIGLECCRSTIRVPPTSSPVPTS